MWKCLHDDPNTAKLLKQIYGCTRPDITYPKVKTIQRATPPPSFLPGGRGQRKARTAHMDAKGPKQVNVPKFKRETKTEGLALIDSAKIRRKRESSIKKEQAINRDKIEHYRPPYVKPSGEDEKSRLAEKFEFGGGKALPEEMTCPAMPIPSEERWKKSEARRVANALRHRKGIQGKNIEDNESVGKEENRKALADNMFDQVASEIEERQQFLLEARESGLPYENEERILAEISHRMKELTRLTQPASPL